MITEVRFTCTALEGTGKQGILPPDADGYYTMPIGALNTYNSVGDYYPYQTVKNLFEQSGTLMRRIQAGVLKGEYGHPKRQPNQTIESYAQRIMMIEEKSVCVHFSEVWLEFDAMKDAAGRPIVAIMAKFKPSGPYADALEKSLNNRREDVCFSIRSFTEDVKIYGVNNRNIVEIVTWDAVTEPGIATARKYKAPGLESIDRQAPNILLYGHVEDIFKKEDIISATTATAGFALESSTEAVAKSLLRKLGWDYEDRMTPKFLDWN